MNTGIVLISGFKFNKNVNVGNINFFFNNSFQKPGLKDNCIFMFVLISKTIF